MSETPSSVSLDDILITAALAQRSPRIPNLQAETQALHTLARQLAEQSQMMLETLVTVAQDLCQAGTAGVSLLEVTADGEEVFRYRAIVGRLASFEGETTPRNFSPCGICLDRQAPQLYSHPERYFTHLQGITPPIVESLVVPLIGATQALGSIWVMMHDKTRQFDSEDVRIMTSLANFTAAALQSLHLRQTTESALEREQTAHLEVQQVHHDLEQRSIQLEATNYELKRTIEELQIYEEELRQQNEELATAREVAEAEKQRYLDLFDFAPDGYVVTNARGLIQEVNQAIIDLLGVEQCFLINTPLSAYIDYSDRKAFRALLSQLRWQSWQQIDELSLQPLHEAAIPVSLTVTAIHHPQGQLVGARWLIRDIRERKRKEAERQQVEAALYQSESRFRLIVDSAKDYAIFTLSLDGIITSWNSGAERLLGYQEAEIIGCHSRTLFIPEDNEQGKAEQEIEKAIAQGRAENERWHIRKDGSRFFASGLMMQLHDEAGKLQGLVKILRDVTETHQATEREQFLSEASAVLAGTLDYKTTLFNIAQLAVPFLADFCFFDILNANHQIERVAWHHGDPAKRNWFEQLQHYTPPQNCENHPITNVLTTGNANLVPHVTAQWMQTATLSAEHLQFMQDCQVQSLITVPLIAHTHKLGALTICLTTTSNRHYTQTDLALAEELGHRAALALDNARLYQQAQEANRIKDEFMAVLSHELRSPLNPILGWLQMIRKGNLDPDKTAKAWATIERNARLQAQLVEDLLDISRILRGKLSLVVGQVNLVTTIHAAIETVQLAAQAKSIAIEPTLDVQIGLILGDATRLQQVVWNLLSNAVKFTSEGGRVEVRLEQIDGYAQIVVSDTGVGIHTSFLPHVFDCFRQADGATTRRFGGLGLGLAIVRQLVEAHGGTVWAESPGEGQGATFTVRLPLTPVQTISIPDSQPSKAALSLQGKQILVVDNEPDALEFAVFVLEQAGANVIPAFSAAEALTLLSQAKPDVLISDIGMPEMDGYMLMQQVRLLSPEQGGQIPAIALTAYAGDINYQQAIAAGFQRHLAKPVNPDILIRAITTLIQTHTFHVS